MRYVVLSRCVGGVYTIYILRRIHCSALLYVVCRYTSTSIHRTVRGSLKHATNRAMVANNFKYVLEVLMLDCEY